MKKFSFVFLIVCICLSNVHSNQCNAQCLPSMLPEESPLPYSAVSSTASQITSALCEMAYTAYGLNFADNDIQETTELAKQYYKYLQNMDFDESTFSEKEIARLRQRNKWLEQGVEIIYDKSRAYKYINSCQLKHKITEDGPGTVLILIVTVPAAERTAEGSGVWDKRIIEFVRNHTGDVWKMRSEGVL